jgi:alpha-tubulin suppressor-like RCC1 family protein
MQKNSNAETSANNQEPTSSQNTNAQDKDYKKLDSGFTFFSFITERSVSVMGNIKDYIGSSNVQTGLSVPITANENAFSSRDRFRTGFTKISLVNKNNANQNDQDKLKADNITISIPKPKIPISKLRFSESYKPVHISCNKHSMAILLRSTQHCEKLKDEVKEFKEFFDEFLSTLKSKGHCFQSFFLNKTVNDLLFRVDHNSDLQAIERELGSNVSFSISEEEFIELMGSILTSEKYQVQGTFKKLYDKFRTYGLISQGKLDTYMLYRIMYRSDDFNLTKLVLIGDFAKTWYKNWSESEGSEVKENWRKIYDSTFVFEMPYLSLPIKQVEMGENHMLILTVEGMVYAVGDGSSGATGDGIRTFHSEPARVKFPYDGLLIKKICAGARHSLAVDQVSDMLYSWGCGLNGRLGHGNERDQFYPKLIDVLSSAKISCVDAGDTYTACVTKAGYLYTWGHGEFGRLGHPENLNQLMPKKVDMFQHNVISVKCGYFCTIVNLRRLDNGKTEIYTLGAKTTQLMQINKINKNLPQDDTVPVLVTNDNQNSYKKVEFPVSRSHQGFKPIKTPILAVSGYQFIALITEETHSYSDMKKYDDDEISESMSQNEVASTSKKSTMNLFDIYIAGNLNMTINQFGTTFYRLLNEEMLKLKLMIERKHLDNKPLEEFIKSLKSFQKIKMIDQEDNEDIQVDISKKKDTSNPSVLHAIKRVVCSDNNTAVLSSEGNVYVFGSYLYRICQEQVENYTIPVQPKGIKIIHMALGANHLIMISSNYEVYGAGRNSEGQLGLGKPSDPVDISQIQIIEKLKNKGVNKCFASENYTVVLSFTNEAHIFGNISFLQKSQFINYQSSPKKIDFTKEIYKIACGPTHLLMMCRDEKNGQINLKAIGNGTYGKLGDDSENEDNRYEPVLVDIQLPGSFTEEDRKKNIILKCSRYNSAVLLQDPVDLKNNKLYIWGLCSRSLFNNPREIEKYEKNKFRQIPIDNTVPICKPLLISPWNEPIRKLALTDTLLYVITQRNELKYNGLFFTLLGKSIALRASGEYAKIALGNDHAAAVTSNNKLFTWGFNVMNKLGFATEEEGGTNDKAETDFDDMFKFLKENATNVENFNKIMDKKKNAKVAINVNTTANSIKEENKNSKGEKNLKINEKPKIEGMGNSTPGNAGNINGGDTPGNMMDKNENNNANGNNPSGTTSDPNQDIDTENIFYQTQLVIKTEFDNLENCLINNELEFKKQLKHILTEYKFLVENQHTLREIKQNLYTSFNFKMEDPPLKIKLKEDITESKLPKEFLRYKRNYKCLLTTLKIHPCYLLNMYKHEYFLKSQRDMFPKDLYKIIKTLFSNKEDKFSLYLLIIIAKEILRIDIEKLLSQCKDENDKKNILDNYTIFRYLPNGDVEFNLFAKIVKLIFKSQIKQNFQQELLATFMIGQVYAKTGGKSNPNFPTAMLLKYNPIKKRKNTDNSEPSTHQKNQRVDLIMHVIESMISNMGSPEAYSKSTLFTITKDMCGKGEKSSSDHMSILTQTSKLLISEIIKIFEKLLKKSQSEKILDFIVKKFPMIIFHKLIKMVKSPKDKIILNAGIMVDRQSFNFFMDHGLHNFYSLSYALRYSFTLFGLGDKANELPDDEMNKLIEKKFKHGTGSNSIIQKLETLMKSLIVSINTNKSTAEYNLDLKLLREFFVHNLEDRSERIPIDLSMIKRLQEVIAPNIENIRILNPEFDLMDLVFFNKKNYPDNYIGEKGGLVSSTDILEGVKIQVNVKTRLLSLQTPATLMKCVHCNVITLHEFVLSNEASFYKEFKFFNKSSIQGRFIQILKTCSPVRVRNDKITEFLKEELNKKDSPVLENFNKMLTLYAVDNKKVYGIDSSELTEQKVLIDIILSRDITNTKFKELCKEIMNKFDKMKNHKDYHDQLQLTLNEILKMKNSQKSQSRPILYDRIKRNFEKGYGNPDIYKNYKNSLAGSCKMIQLEKHINELPKSKNLMGKLPKEKKEKLLPFRDYELKKLMDDKIIFRVLLTNCDADQFPQNYKIFLQRTEKSEFVLTLSKKIKTKTNCWSCKGSDINTKKVHSTIITNDLIKYFTNKAKTKSVVDEDATAFLDNFLQIDPKQFINILKELSSVALE